MRKLFTTILLLTGIYTASQAQKKGQWEFGAGVGVNASYAVSTADNASGTDTRLDPNFSLQAEYMIGDQWGLKAEAIYNTKGWGNGFYKDVTNSQQVINVNYSIHYITIPILATWHIDVEKLWFLNAGPYIGFLTSASNDYNHEKMKNSYKSTEEGVQVGVGIQFPLSEKSERSKIFFEYNWQFGASNVLANSANGSATLMRQALGAGIRF